jgi:hypothetical protein
MAFSFPKHDQKTLFIFAANIKTNGTNKKKIHRFRNFSVPDRCNFVFPFNNYQELFGKK